jgi:hypothetical protein
VNTATLLSFNGLMTAESEKTAQATAILAGKHFIMAVVKIIS